MCDCEPAIDPFMVWMIFILGITMVWLKIHQLKKEGKL